MVFLWFESSAEFFFFFLYCYYFFCTRPLGKIFKSQTRWFLKNYQQFLSIYLVPKVRTGSKKSLFSVSASSVTLVIFHSNFLQFFLPFLNNIFIICIYDYYLCSRWNQKCGCFAVLSQCKSPLPPSPFFPSSNSKFCSWLYCTAAHDDSHEKLAADKG